MTARADNELYELRVAHLTPEQATALVNAFLPALLTHLRKPVRDVSIIHDNLEASALHALLVNCQERVGMAPTLTALDMLATIEVDHSSDTEETYRLYHILEKTLQADGHADFTDGLPLIEATFMMAQFFKPIDNNAPPAYATVRESVINALHAIQPTLEAITVLLAAAFFLYGLQHKSEVVIGSHWEILRAKLVDLAPTVPSAYYYLATFTHYEKGFTAGLDVSALAPATEWHELTSSTANLAPLREPTITDIFNMDTTETGGWHLSEQRTETATFTWPDALPYHRSTSTPSGRRDLRTPTDGAASGGGSSGPPVLPL